MVHIFKKSKKKNSVRLWESESVSHSVVTSSLWLPTDCSPLGSSVHGIFQARILEWVAISFSEIFFLPILLKYSWHAMFSGSVVSNSVTPWTVACQAPLSMGFSRQEYWSGLPCPPPGGLSGPGIEPLSLMSPALRDRFIITSST